MAGALIHPHLPGRIGGSGQGEAQPALGVGAAQGQAGAIGGNQADPGASSGFSAAELALQLKGAVEAGNPLKAAVEGMGPGRGRAQRQLCHSTGQSRGGQQRPSAGQRAQNRHHVQEAFQRLWGVLPACTICTIEVTIIDRAPLLSPRLCSSAASTRSGAVRPLSAPCRASGQVSATRAGKGRRVTGK